MRTNGKKINSKNLKIVIHIENFNHPVIKRYVKIIFRIHN